MPDLIEIEPCTTSCTSNSITFQCFQCNKNNNSNSNPKEQSNERQSYPGMVNRVCNVFGMKPEEYNTKLITETFYSNYLKKRRDLNDENNNNTDHHKSYANNNVAKKRKYW
ncbi:hypothetical protein MOSE0_I02300 [Monosporozyma servazzii]